MIPVKFVKSKKKKDETLVGDVAAGQFLFIFVSYRHFG